VTLTSKQRNTPGSQKRSRTGDNAITLRVYLLTVWQETGQEAGIWRFRLEDPHTHWRRGFVNAQDLISILEDGLPGQDAEQNAGVDEETSEARNE